MKPLFKNFLCALLLANAAASQAQSPELHLTDELRRELMAAVTQVQGAADNWDAQVWLTAKNTRLQEFVKDESARLSLLHMIHEEANRAGLPTELVLAVIEVESRFDPYAVSSAGAQGLMQVMSFWKNELGRSEDNLTDIRTNLRYGCTILAHYRNIEKTDLGAALARYNGSYGQTWYAQRVFDAMSRWR